MPAPLTAAVLVDTGVEQESITVGLRYRVKVMVPVGLKPWVRWAVSWMEPPAATDADAVVVRNVAFLLTTTDSLESVHNVGPTELLLASALM